MNFWDTAAGKVERARYSKYYCEHLPDDNSDDYCRAPASVFEDAERNFVYLRCPDHASDVPAGYHCSYAAEPYRGGVVIDERLDT